MHSKPTKLTATSKVDRIKMERNAAFLLYTTSPS